jgi:hypothetical protein
LTEIRLLDYDYGSAPGSNKSSPDERSAIRGALVRGNSPLNSLGLRTEMMLDCRESLATLADPDATQAMGDGWPDFVPPLSGRHPGDEEEEPEGEEIDDEEGIVGDDFDDDEDEEFDDEEFDDEDEEDIDEGLDDEIDDIDVDDDEDDDFDDDDDLDELDEDEEEDLDDL